MSQGKEEEPEELVVKTEIDIVDDAVPGPSSRARTTLSPTLVTLPQVDGSSQPPTHQHEAQLTQIITATSSQVSSVQPGSRSDLPIMPVVDQQHHPVLQIQQDDAGQGQGFSSFDRFLMVFYIDMIAKSIFGFLDDQSLENCEAIEFFQVNARKVLHFRKAMHFFNFLCPEENGLKDYTTEQNFPRSKYRFRNQNALFPYHLNNEELQSFLKICGHYVRDLELDFQDNASIYYHRDDPSNVIKESCAMSLLKNLILHQCVFIRNLTINIFCKIIWKRPEYGMLRPLRKSDTEFKDIVLENVYSERNPCLRTINILGNVSAKILEMIILISPNLAEIKLPEALYGCYLEPENRVRYLKSVTISRSALATLEMICEFGAGHLNLRNIEFELKDYQTSFQVTRNTQIEIRLIRVLNTFFESSSESIESLSWTGVGFFHELVWPSKFPNIIKLEIGSPLEGKRLCSLLFSTEFNLARMFPKLQHIVIFHHTRDEYKINIFNFLNCLSFDTVETVKVVEISSWRADYDLNIRLKKMFPNGRIIYCP